MTKQFAVELAPLGIRVYAAAPGPVDTAMAKAVHSPEIRADYAALGLPMLDWSSGAAGIEPRGREADQNLFSREAA
jgi:NAD(P)-dependent dehydrogenase (short-subunit alcohol dehydrogenase family)